jgi:hypothetical protein
MYVPAFSYEEKKITMSSPSSESLAGKGMQRIPTRNIKYSLNKAS